jgi:asparagine synthase (glutamine-hydrolysing)
MLMIYSIEGRVPFIENDLIRFAFNLPFDKKVQGNDTKRIVKQVALRYLPENVVNRRKIGFTVPFHAYVSKFPKILEDGFVAEWTGLTKRELMAWCEGNLNDLYRLISIEVWGRIFVHKTPWTDIRVET